MVNRTFYESIAVTDAAESEEKGFVLDYYLLKKDISVDGFSLNTYGIEIVKRKSVRGEALEYRRVFDVFCMEDEALAAIRRLAENTVTPVSLLDVLEDMIGIGDLVNEECVLTAAAPLPAGAAISRPC